MDRKKLQTLEILFRFLVNNPLVLSTQVEYQQIKSVVNTFNDMGLDFEQNDSYVRLLTQTQSINLKKLSTALLNNKVAKPINYYFSTASTNNEAKHDKRPAVFVAEHQSLGQGRQAKQWLSPLGQSINLSINHDFNFGLNHLAGLNTAIGVAIINTARYFGDTSCGLKWPNDVISTHGKIAGVLIEASGNNKQSQVTIGIGINWQLSQNMLNKVPQECCNIAIDIATCSKTEFISHLIIEVEKTLVEFKCNQLQNLINKWHKFDLFEGCQIRVYSTQKSYTAKYLNVDLQGMLRINVNNKIKTIASGEVSIRKVD